MKHVFSVLLSMVLVLGLATSAYAQKPSKEEKKQAKEETKTWKKKAKSYAKAPLSLRDDLAGKDETIKKLNADIADLKKKLAACNNTADSLQELANKRAAELAALETKYQKLQAAYEAAKNVVEKDIDPGLIYRVQCGAFVHFDINQYLKDTGENFEGETKDGMNKYTMGKFKDSNVADLFKKDVQKMGIKDAWVVPYIDGQRVTHEEAKKHLEKQGGGGSN